MKCDHCGGTVLRDQLGELSCINCGRSPHVETPVVETIAPKHEARTPVAGRKRAPAKPDDGRTAQQRWRARNPGRVREYQKSWRAANREKMAEYHRKYVDHNREKVREWHRAYRERERHSGEEDGTECSS